MAEVTGRGKGFSAGNPLHFKTVEQEKRFFRSLERTWRILYSHKVCSFQTEAGVIDKYRVDLHEIVADGIYGEPDVNRFDYCYFYCDAHADENETEPPAGFEIMDVIYDPDEKEARERSSDDEREYSVAVLAHAFAGGNLNELESRLADGCTYTSEAGGVDLSGKEEILKHIQHVHDVNEQKQYCYFGEIVESSSEVEHEADEECLVIASGVDDNFISIVFVDTDSNGLIQKIVLTSDERYGVAVDGIIGNIGYYFIPTFSRRMFNIANRKNKETGRGLPLHVVSFYANAMDYINRVSGFHINHESLYEILEFMIDISFGYYDEYSVSGEDPYRDVLRIMEDINLTDSLAYEENLAVAFALYYAAFYLRKSEETGRGVIRIDEFCYPENIDKTYAEMKARNPELFDVKPDEIRCYADDPESEPDEYYGLVPEKPVELGDISGEYWFLNQLYFEDGSPVETGKQAAISVEGYPKVVDQFEILRNGEFVTYIYLYGYSEDFNSRYVCAPKGFIFVRK